MRYKTFKNELMNYKSYLHSIDEIERRIDDICYQYCGVRGISYDKVGITFNEHMNAERWQRLHDALIEPQRELDHTIIKIHDIERNLSKLPEQVKEMCIKLFVEGHSFQYVGHLNNYSANGIYQLVKREVEKI